MSQFNEKHDNSRATKRSLEEEEESRRPRDPRRRLDGGGDTPHPSTVFQPVLLRAPAPVVQSSGAAVPEPPKDPRVRPDVPFFLPAPDWSRKEPVSLPDPRPRPQPEPPKDPRVRPDVPFFLPAPDWSRKEPVSLPDPRPRLQPEPPKDRRQLPVVPSFGGGAAQSPRAKVHVDTPHPAAFTPVLPKSVVKSDAGAAGAAGGVVAVQPRGPEKYDQLLFGFLCDLGGKHKLPSNQGSLTLSCTKSKYDSFCCFQITDFRMPRPRYPNPQSEEKFRSERLLYIDDLCGVYAELMSDNLQVKLPKGSCLVRIFCRLGNGALTYLVWSPVTIRIYSERHNLPLVFPTGDITPATLPFKTLEIVIQRNHCNVEFSPYRYDLSLLHNPVSIPGSKTDNVIAEEHLHRRYVHPDVPHFSAQRLTKYLVWQAVQYFINRFNIHPNIQIPEHVKIITDYLFETLLNKNTATFEFWLMYWRVQDNITEYLQLFCKPFFKRYIKSTEFITLTPKDMKLAVNSCLLPPRDYVKRYVYNSSLEPGRRLQVAVEEDPSLYCTIEEGFRNVCFKIEIQIQSKKDGSRLHRSSQFEGWYTVAFVPQHYSVNHRFEKVYDGSSAFLELRGTDIRLYNAYEELSFPYPDRYIGKWNMPSLGSVVIPSSSETIIVRFLPFEWGPSTSNMLSPTPLNKFENLIQQKSIDLEMTKCFFPRYICYTSKDPGIPALAMGVGDYARNIFMSLIPMHYDLDYLYRPRIHGKFLSKLTEAFKERVSSPVFVYLGKNDILKFADWIYLFKKMFGFPYLRAEERGGDGGGGGGRQDEFENSDDDS